MALSDFDRKLLERCLGRKPRAWEDFVDRYMGLVMHVINHSAQARSIRLSNEDREDLCTEVCMALVPRILPSSAAFVARAAWRRI